MMTATFHNLMTDWVAGSILTVSDASFHEMGKRFSSNGLALAER